MPPLWLTGLAMLPWALFNLGVGLRVLVGKKPVVYPARLTVWLLLVLFALILPTLVSPFTLNRRLNGGWTGTDLMIPIVGLSITFMLISLWYHGRGYTLTGVGHDSFRNALRYALGQADLPFEEQLSQVWLPTLGAVLRISGQLSTGSAQLSISPRQHGATLKRLTRLMADYWRQNPPQVRSVGGVTSVVSGIFMLSFTVAIVLTDSDFRSLRPPFP